MPEKPPPIQPARYRWRNRAKRLRDGTIVGERAELTGLDPTFRRFERDVVKGKRPVPFTVQFFDRDGNLIGDLPVKLDAEGRRVGSFMVKGRGE